MTQENLLIAAQREGVDVVGVSRLEPETEDSFYEWNELIVEVEGFGSGLKPEPIIVCWRLVFEGKFQRGDEHVVDCPTTPPPVVDLPPTVPPRPSPEVLIGERNMARMQALLESSELVGLTSDDIEAAVKSSFGELPSAQIDAIERDGQIAIAIRDDRYCYFGLTLDPVITWRPVASGLDCSASNAADGPP
jgi:hypothetical protein